MDKINRMNEEELKKECSKWNLPADGSIEEMRNHLEEHLSRISGNQADKHDNDKNTEESDSDEDIGPMRFINANTGGNNDNLKKMEEEAPRISQKRPSLKNESFILSDLPCAEMYEKSYTHPAPITHVITTPATNFLYTSSVNGSVKIWKKFPTGIEFVKHFGSHKGRVTSLVSSCDGLLVASSGEDKTIKIYDVVNFDMIMIMKIDFIPGPMQWVYKADMNLHYLAVADAEKNVIHVYNIDSQEIVYTFKYHKAKVIGVVYNVQNNFVISLDEKGVFEYWVPTTGAIPKESVSFKFKAMTDLYELNKKQIVPLSLSISSRGKWISVYGSDWKMYVWDTRTGKLELSLDESDAHYKEQQSKEEIVENRLFNKRLGIEEKVHEKLLARESNTTINAVFDQTENFILFCGMFTIKIVNLVSQETVVTMGLVENSDRFMSIALFQGISKVSSQMKLGLKKLKPNDATDESSADVNKKHFDGNEEDGSDPCVFVTAFDKRRFYIFSRREPVDSNDDPRDIINEKEVAEDDILKEQGVDNHYFAKRAVIHTTMGDIEVELWRNIAPKAVENFSTLSKNDYYNNVIFHRVIKNFMIQTGDPTGSGFGGESMWKKPFEDETRANVTFDKPFLLAMANCGYNTNGSQFFINTVPTEHLNGKHTIFGKVLKGINVVRAIETVRIQKDADKPFDDIKIISIDTYKE